MTATRSFLFKISSLALLLAIASLPAAAQSAGTGIITGTVTDSTGAIVPNATVLVMNVDTGSTRTISTNSSGSYTAFALQSGHYEVILGGGAYGKLDRKNLVLTVGQTMTVDATLPAASVSSEIIVTTSGPLVDTEKVQVSQTVDQRLVSTLPVNGRRFDNFVLLTPNVVPDGSSGLLSFRGISGLYNSNLVDGTSNQQALFSEARGRAVGSPYTYSLDSIKEFESSASGYSAEFGQAAGGVINAITKSGTNAFHGDLFYYLRYPTLNALDPVAKYTGRQSSTPANVAAALLQPSVHQQQQFGGSVGGPIIKDKLFFFGTYDGFRRVSPLLLYNTNLAALGTTSSNGYACPAAITATQCANAKAYIAGTQGAFPRTTVQDIFFAKLDYQLNDKNHVSASFNWANYKQPNSYISGNTSPNISNTSNGSSFYHERYLVGSWETVLSSKAVNSLHAQWSRDLETQGTNGPGPDFKIGSTSQSSALLFYGEATGLPRAALPDEHRIQVFDTYSTTLGKHTVKAGFDLNFIHDVVINLFTGDGVYTYSAFAGQTQTGNAGGFYNWVEDVYGVNGSYTGGGATLPITATFQPTLARHYSAYTQVIDNQTGKNGHVAGGDDFWNQNIAGFVQDDWKVTPKVLVSAGLRYDLQLVPQPPIPYTNSYNGVPSPLGNSVTNTIHINKTMFAPRLGFSWSPMNGTVVRGGYGIFYALTSNSTFYATRVENGVFQTTYNATTPTVVANPAAPDGSGVTVEYGAANTDPYNTGVFFTPPGPALAAPFAGAVTPAVNGTAGLTKLAFRGQDPKFTNPYTHSFDLAVEQALPFHSTLSISYVGSRGMRLPYFIDANLPQTTLTKTYDVTNAAGVTQSTITVPFYSSTLARPSPNDGIILVGYSGLNSWYHSMVTTIRKPFSNGLELLANYTWSKAIDGSQVIGTNGTYDGTNVILDPHNLKGTPGAPTTKEYAKSDLDMRGRFVGSIVYAPTFHVARIYTQAVNGWSIGATATEATGQPLTANLTGSSPSGALDGGVTGGSVGNSPAASIGRAPQIIRNGIPGPGIRNVDARLSKDFMLPYGMKFQVTTEVFNIANRRMILIQNTSAYSLACPAGPAHTNSCVAPVTGFGTPTTTTGTIYGPRQMQFIAKLFF